MDLRDYLRVVRSRYKLIILSATLSVGIALLATFSTTAMYSANAQLFVSTVGTGDVGAAYTGGLFSQQRVKSYPAIIRSRTITTPVIAELGVPLTHAELASRISVSVPQETVLLNISVEDESPARAQALANAVAKQFSTSVQDIEAALADGSIPVKVSIFEEASLPTSPVSPRPTLNLSLGLLAGLAVGFGSALLRNVFDARFSSLTDLRDRTGLPNLAVIGRDPEAAKTPLIASLARTSPRAEAFRQLRTNLQFVDIDRPARSVMVTSALPGEGKSTSSTNLAIALADAGVDVILVEGDLRRPRIGEYLGLENAVGLTDVLIGRVELEDVLQEWGASGRLKVLLGGPTPPNPSELLGSAHMASLVGRLQKDAFVVLDAPPLLPVTDAAVMAGLVSGVVLVVRAQHTRHEQVEQALASLRSVGANVYGTIFNMAPTKGPDAVRYGYGYGYGDVGAAVDLAATSIQPAPTRAREEPPIATRSDPPAGHVPERAPSDPSVVPSGFGWEKDPSV